MAEAREMIRFERTRQVGGSAARACLLCCALFACRRDADPLIQHARELEGVRSELELIARDLRLYDRIWEMDDGTRSFGTINGTPVMPVTYAGDSAVPGPFITRLPIAEVLERDSIDLATYNSIRMRLARAGIQYVKIATGYTVFLVGGSLDNMRGYILVAPGGQPPEVGEDIAGGRIVFLRPIARIWFYFATS